MAISRLFPYSAPPSFPGVSPVRQSQFACALVALAAVSCGPTQSNPPPPTKIATTYRVIGGVSMGGIGAAALGLSRPERFDGVATLGGPLDAAYFQRMLDRFVMGGFCTREELEAILASDPVKLNDPAVIDACAKPATPMKWEHKNDFNHWHTTNNGGTFDRDSYGHMVSDLTLAYGNLVTENPASPVAPPGVDPERIRHFPADFCTNPTRVPGLKNLEYNPEGKYDAITFCDGEPTLYFCRDTMERVDFCADPANIVAPLPVAQEVAFANADLRDEGRGGAGEQERSHALLAGEHRPRRPVPAAAGAAGHPAGVRLQRQRAARLRRAGGEQQPRALGRRGRRRLRRRVRERQRRVPHRGHRLGRPQPRQLRRRREPLRHRAGLEVGRRRALPRPRPRRRGRLGRLRRGQRRVRRDQRPASSCSRSTGAPTSGSWTRARATASTSSAMAASATSSTSG